MKNQNQKTNDIIISDIEKFIKDNNVKHIYLDVDGVLIHSCQAICDMLNEDRGTNFRGDQILSWNFKEICPDLTDNDIERLFADYRFFKYVQWIKGVKEFVKRHKKHIIIVTKGTTLNIFRKILFFNQHNISVLIEGLPLDKRKSERDMSDGLFIDDCTKNLIESNAKYKIQFLEYDDELNEHREWIKGFDGYKMYKWS